MRQSQMMYRGGGESKAKRREGGVKEMRRWVLGSNRKGSFLEGWMVPRLGVEKGWRANEAFREK